MSRAELIDASGLTEPQFDRLVSICVENGHFTRREWENKKVIAVPAMARRADTYTKRRVRRVFEHGSKDVPPQDSTNQTNPKKNPPTPRADARRAAPKVTRKLREQAEQVLRNRFGNCMHDPRCVDRATCLLAVVAELRAQAS